MRSNPDYHLKSSLLGSGHLRIGPFVNKISRLQLSHDLESLECKNIIIILDYRDYTVFEKIVLIID